MREYTAIPDEYLDEMETLTDEEYGRLIRALQRFHLYGTVEELEGNEKHFLKRVINREERFKKQFDDIDARNKANGAKGGRPTKPKETQENPEKPKETQAKPKETQKTETKTKTKTNNIINSDKSLFITSELQKCSSEAVVKIPLLDGTEYDVTETEIKEWRDAYPAIDVEQELKAMRQWCISNPKNKKTARGVRRFITAWLERSQNSARKTGGKDAKQNYDEQLVKGWTNGVGFF